MDPVGIGGLIVGIVGIVFGVKQYFDMKRTETRLHLITDQLRASERRAAVDSESLKTANHSLVENNQKLAEANEQIAIIRRKMVTVSVARFPLNLNSLVELMDSAVSELEILCDFVGYAMYSNVSGFQRYFDSLERALKRGVKVRLLLYGLDAGRQAIGKQLPPSNYLQERNSVFCTDYFRQYHPGRACPTSYNEFRDTLLRDEEQLISKIQQVELKVMDHSLVTFVWIADQTKACIFSFRNDGNDEAGMTFQSHDGQIVTNFRAVFDSEWGRASEPLYKGRW